MQPQKDGDFWKVVEHLSEALSQSFIGMLRDVRPLVPFVEHSDPQVAYLALKMADFLQDILLEDYGIHPKVMPLKPLVVKSATHPHWWVRYTTASLLPQRVPLGVYIRLLSDPEPAVIGKAIENLLDLPIDKAERVLHRLSSRSKVTLRLFLSRWVHDKSLRNLLPEEYRTAESLYAFLEALPEPGRNSLSSDLERLQEISPKAVLQLPSEALALLSTGFFPPFGMQLPSEVLDEIACFHPDPIARVLALLGWGSSQPSDLVLLEAAQQEHLPTVVTALLSLRWKIDADNYSWLRLPILGLTHHPCLLVVQIAARVLKEAVDCAEPDEELVGSLVSLSIHPDPLVRVNALYSLRDYWAAPTSLRERLFQAWADETISVVKVAFANTLWWLMSPREWWTQVGRWLWNFENGGWRHQVRNLVSLWRSRDAEEALDVVSFTSLRRILRKHKNKEYEFEGNN